MSDINELFASDLDKEKHGTWIVPLDGRGRPVGTARFKIACIDHNPEFQESLRAAVEQRKVTLNAKELTEEQHLDAFREAVSQTILVDWEDVAENGQPVPYSWEKAYAWLKDPEKWRFSEWILTQAKAASNFRKELLEDQVKN